MRNLTFSELHSLIQNEQSFSKLGHFYRDNILSMSALTAEQRRAIADAYVDRRNFLADRDADRLAERSHTRKAA